MTNAIIPTDNPRDIFLRHLCTRVYQMISDARCNDTSFGIKIYGIQHHTVVVSCYYHMVAAFKCTALLLE